MKKKPLAIAVFAVMSSFAYAETAPAVQTQELQEVVVTDRQGSKVRTNIVTLAERNERTDTDLRSLLSEEPSIEFGGGNGTSQF